MIKLTFLGTACAVSSKNRDNTALLLKTDKEIFLIDCPGSPVSKLKRINSDFRKIDKILFTHSHPDHIYGLPSLLHSQYKLGNRVFVYAKKEVISLIKALVKIYRLEDKSRFPQLIYKNILPDLNEPFYKSKDLSIFSFEVMHSLNSVGFKFVFKDGKSIVFTGDTAYSEKTLRASRDTDYLISDCFSPSRFFKVYKELKREHTDSLSLGRLAKRANVKVLVPIHFCRELSYSFEEVIEEIRRNFKGKIIIPKDCVSLRLD